MENQTFIPLHERQWDFPEGENTIDTVDELGNAAKVVQLSNNRIAVVVQKSGEAVENSTMIAGKNQKKYMTSMMAACVTVDGLPVVMEDLSKFLMKDYFRIQAAFSELNF